MCMDPPFKKPGKKTEILSLDYAYVVREQRNKIGKKYALKKYDQFALNTSCFRPEVPYQILPYQILPHQLCNFVKLHRI